MEQIVGLTVFTAEQLVHPRSDKTWEEIGKVLKSSLNILICAVIQYSAAAAGRGRVAVSAATLALLMIIIMMMISSSSPSDDGGGDKVCFLSSTHFKRGKLEVNETNAPIGRCVILIEKVSMRTCNKRQVKWRCR